MPSAWHTVLAMSIPGKSGGMSGLKPSALPAAVLARGHGECADKLKN